MRIKTRMDSCIQEKVTLVRRYFELLSLSDIDGIIELFDDHATVVSPFLGELNAAVFFKKLGQASAESSLTVFDVLIGENSNSAAAHFQYDWTLKDGQKLTFQGVDYFQFADDGKFASMKIFYDTHPVRETVGDKYA